MTPYHLPWTSRDLHRTVNRLRECARVARRSPMLLAALPIVFGILLSSQRVYAQPLPRYERGPCTFHGADSLGSKAECGTLLVHEGSGPNHRTLRISVAVLKAPGAKAKPDPVVYLSGGPGGRGMDDAHAWLTRPFARERDIVLVDQRGTGQSDALCPDAAKDVVRLMARDLSPADDMAGNVAIARRCLRDLRQRGRNPVDYSSAATAMDLERLREALGYEKWNLLGISYGARLGLTVMRDHPEGIRSVVLDSPFPPSEDFYLTLRQSSRAALQRLTADCAAAPSCSTVDIEAGLAAFEAELASRPLALDMDDPEIAPGGTFVLNVQDLRFLVTELLAFGSTRAVLPAFVHAWRMGHRDSLVALFKVMAHAFDGHDVGKYYAVQCHEEMPFSVLGGLDRTANPGEGASYVAFHDAAPWVCADWGLPVAPVRENAPVRSAIPALLIAGELDSESSPGLCETCSGAPRSWHAGGGSRSGTQHLGPDLRG